MSDVLRRLGAVAGEKIPLYDSFGKVMSRVDGLITEFEFGSRLGFPKERRIYSVAFVWEEGDKERACVLGRSNNLSDLDRDSLVADLKSGKISISCNKNNVYRASVA